MFTVIRKALRVLEVARVSDGDSALRTTIPQAFLLHPLVFSLWYWSRLAAKPLALQRIRSASDVNGDARVREEVVGWNVKNRHGVSRARMERLIILCRLLLGADARRAKVLVVGPRNEAELLLLRAYGFRAPNITAIDLFSTSRHIQVMDMHHMAFPADTFDVLVANYVLSYSPDRKRACGEYIRVVKPGGLIGVSFVSKPASHLPDVEPIRGGVEEVSALFAGATEHVYWKEQRRPDCSLLLKVRKVNGEPDAGVG